MGTRPPFDLPVDNPAVPEVFVDGFMWAAGPDVVRVAFHASQPGLTGEPPRPRIVLKLAMTPTSFRSMIAGMGASLAEFDRQFLTYLRELR